jgi:hypothetical protein
MIMVIGVEMLLQLCGPCILLITVGAAERGEGRRHSGGDAL